MAVGTLVAPEIPSALPQPVTFDEELAMLGIPTYDLKAVRRYQERYLREQQALGLTGPWPAWETLTPEAFMDWQYGVIPPDVAKTIERAQEVPDSKVVIQRFNEDPFVFIRKTDGPWAGQERCIAFWDTDFVPPESGGKE